MFVELNYFYIKEVCSYLNLTVGIPNKQYLNMIKETLP